MLPPLPSRDESGGGGEEERTRPSRMSTDTGKVKVAGQEVREQCGARVKDAKRQVGVRAEKKMQKEAKKRGRGDSNSGPTVHTFELETVALPLSHALCCCGTLFEISSACW